MCREMMMLAIWMVGGGIAGLLLSALTNWAAYRLGVGMSNAPQEGGSNSMTMLWCLFIGPFAAILGAALGLVLRAKRWFRHLPAVAAVLCVTAAGCTRTITPAESSYPWKDRIVSEIVLASTGEAVPDTPDGKPIGKCDNCKGTGIVGDGVVKNRCPACGGDGTIDEEDVQFAASGQVRESRGKIVLHVSKRTCAGWPTQWWRDGAATSLAKAGFTVSYVNHSDDDLSRARIDVTPQGSNKTWESYSAVDLEDVDHLAK